MSEQTEKTNPSPRKAPAAKRPPRKTRASGSGSKTAARKKAGQDKPLAGDTLNKGSLAKNDAAPKVSSPPKSDSKDLAPDPATITFGSNKPIVAAPPPKPVSSGLRFSGPSAGVLKASGPQATSPKADGLTFTSAAGTSAETDAQTATGAKVTAADGKDPAKTSGTKAPTDKANDTKTAPKKAAGAKTDTKTPGKDEAKPGQKTAAGAQAKDGKATEPKTAKDKTPQKQPAIGKPGVTKPAIAPQNSGPLIEKTPSRRPALALLGFGCAVAGLAWWLGNQQPPEPRIAGKDTAAVAGAGEADATATGTPATGSSSPATTASSQSETESAATANSTAALPSDNSVTVAELWEIQDLLRQLDLGPGTSSGQMTAATRDAIRSYQEMAGLPVNGEASPALLRELRSVAALYGG